MPISVIRYPDPSSAAWKAQGSPQARSETLDILRSSLERYLRGEISGRSILISGHRGAGKTTLIDSSLNSAEVAGTRPLRVPLYGPNLFPEPLAKPATAKPAENEQGKKKDDSKAGAPDEKAEDKAKSDSAASAEIADAHRVLMELTVSLYRALVKEVAQSYERAISNRPPSGRLRRPFELTGRLVLELDDAPGPDRLRRYWEMAGALQSGILFRGPGFFSLSSAVPSDQGIREMVAIASAAQAFRVVAGKLNLSESKLETDENTRTSSSESKIDIKALLGGVLGLASGLFGAAGVYFVAATATGTAGAGGLGAGLAAFVAAFASARAATRTTTRKTTRGRDYKFIRDFKLDTLGRELPNLIERLRHAGLAPVFVVDELDKVPQLATNLRGLVRQLKPLVAERTFFCFLTDREYYEHLRAQSREIAYAAEHTYFTHRLFVSYAPEELRAYLGSVLRADASNEQEERALELDIFATMYLLLYRARMHHFDLNVQLQRLAVEQAAGRRPSGKVRTDTGIGYAITYQLAVETILRQEEVRTRLVQDPYLGQVIYDALYFPADSWDRNNIKFTLSLKTLRDHLATRMHLEPKPDLEDDGASLVEHEAEPIRAKSKRKNPPKVDVAQVKVERLLSTTDLQFIFDRLEEMMSLLANPEQSLISRLRSARIDVDIIALVSKYPLVTIDGHECTFEFDAFGRPLKGLDQTRLDELRRALPYIQSMNDAVRSATTSLGDPCNLGTFSDRFGVLDTSPAWQAVEPVMRRLDAIVNSNRIEGDEAKDALAIVTYSGKLEVHNANIPLTIVCGRYIAEVANVSFAAGLDTVARLFGFGNKDAGAVGLELQRILRDVLQIQLPSLVPLRPEDSNMWPIKFSAEMPIRAPQVTLAESRRNLWTEFARRWELRQYLGEPDEYPSRDQLICAAAGVDLSRYFAPDLRRTTIAAWTVLLRLGFEDKDENESDYIPLWVALAAAVMLRLPAAGFDWKAVRAFQFKKRVAASAEIETFERLESHINAALRTQPPSGPIDFVLAVVGANSPALYWPVGDKVVGLVTRHDAVAALVAMCDRLFPSPPAALVLRKAIAAEAVTSDDSGVTPLLRSSRFFSGIKERRLIWDVTNQATTADPSTSILGHYGIDELVLTEQPIKPVPTPATS